MNSSRFPGKPLKKINGIPIIIHTLSRVKLAKGIDDIFVCTDSDKIKKLIEKFGGKALISTKKHKNGTERISEFAKKIKANLFIDVHSDEALLNPKNVDRLIEFHKKNKKQGNPFYPNPFQDLYPESIKTTYLVLYGKNPHG